MTTINVSNPAVTVNVANTDVTVTVSDSAVTLTVQQGQPGPPGPAGGVTSVTGTANEVTVSPTTGAVVVGLPDSIIVQEVNTDWIDFSKTPITTDAQARTYWDSTYETLTLGLDSNVQLKMGQGLYKRGRNQSGVTINKGEVVFISGSHALTEIGINLASALFESTSANTIGMAAETIAANTTGFVQVFGYLTGITTNTPAFPATEGDPFYLSPTNGGTTPTLPTQPLHGVRLGFLAKRAGSGAGSVFISPQNYQEIEELSDVLIGTASGGTALADGDVLSWVAAQSVWRNKVPKSVTVNLQEFYDDTPNGGSATGTVWTKPTGAISVLVQMCGGGASGATGSTTFPGSGGGGGGYVEATFRATDLPATVNIVIGAGGTSGSGTDTGGTSQFGTTDIFVQIPGGRGTSSSNAYTARLSNMWGGGGTSGSAGLYGGQGPGGGGAGAGVSVGNAGGLARRLSYIAGVTPTTGGGGTGGATNGGTGGDGTVRAHAIGFGDGGGGGGSGLTITGGTGGKGIRGGGGGGGGVGSTLGGTAGRGGNGYIRVTTICYA